MVKKLVVINGIVTEVDVPKSVLVRLDNMEQVQINSEGLNT